MKSSDKNIILITAGGVGHRFGGNTPKQYMNLLGRPIISYVIEECRKSIYADAILIAADPSYHQELSLFYGVDTVSSGQELNQTKRNGLDYIRANSACKKVIVVDAVRPTIDYTILDRMFERLDEYDAVACARKITDSLGCYGEWYINREKYYTLNAPEGFRFSLIDSCFNPNSVYTESIQQLPRTARVYLDFDVPYFDKITYPEDLLKIEAIMRQRQQNSDALIINTKGEAPFEKSVLFSKGIRNFFFVRENADTVRWIEYIYHILPNLFTRWSISSFSVNQIARYGLVLLAHSTKYGEVVLKCIPDFVNRYEREKEAISILSPEFMCPLLDWDDESRTMLLKQIIPGKFASFDVYHSLMTFFKSVRDNAVPYDGSNPPKYITFYIDDLRYRANSTNLVPFLAAPIKKELDDALVIWDQYFKNEKLYIIHGDLHELNLLDDGERLWGIDPCGFIAPLVFEYVRFIRNDIRNHLSFGYQERFELLIHCFEEFANRQCLIAAFIVDMAFCTYNSTFENEDMEETLVDLKLLEIAHRSLNNEFNG